MAQKLRYLKTGKATVKPHFLFNQKLTAEKGSEERQVQLSKMLLDAAQLGETKRVERLLKLGAPINVSDVSGFTALMYTARYAEHADTCALLLKNGADANAMSLDSGTGTALMWAAQNGYISICKLLIDYGADVNAQQFNNCTALIYAAKNGHTKICALLIEKGADTKQKDVWGMNAFMRAKDNKKTETAGFLALTAIGPSLFTDKKKQNLFYSSFYDCLSSA